MDPRTQRIIFEMGTLVSAKGHADGITRVARNFLQYAAAHRPDVVFAIYDIAKGVFFEMDPARLPAVIAGANVDISHFPDPFALRPRLRERLPAALKRLAFWLQRPRRRALVLSERIRLSLSKPSRMLERIQDWLLSAKYRAELSDGTGGRRTLFPFDMVFTKPLQTSPSDIALFVGAEFPSMRQCCLRRSDPNSPRIVMMCQDIIPLMFPEYFKPQQVRRFAVCFHDIFPLADLTVFSTKRIESDVRDYCSRHGFSVRKSAVVPLGANTAPVTAGNAPLPEMLLAGKYALFVSTLEPRKNHRLLFDVWKLLLRMGVPQANGFKLVFVGRPGWLIDGFLEELRADPCYQDSLIVLSDVNDATLHRLYADAAFCLYPSLYEGFGLPVVESFRYGKAVIASTGGALPEVVQNFSPTLDPADTQAWLATLQRWIEDPSARSNYEHFIQESFRPRDWSEASRDLFETIDREFEMESVGNPRVDERSAV